MRAMYISMILSLICSSYGFTNNLSLWNWMLLFTFKRFRKKIIASKLVTLSDQLFYTSFQNIGILQIRETMGMTRSKEMEDLNYKLWILPGWAQVHFSVYGCDNSLFKSIKLLILESLFLNYIIFKYLTNYSIKYWNND